MVLLTGYIFRLAFRAGLGVATAAGNPSLLSGVPITAMVSPNEPHCAVETGHALRTMQRFCVCSSFCSLDCAQGFGKRKNMVGMARAKKKAVEVAQTTDQDGGMIDYDMGGSGAEGSAPILSNCSHPPADEPASPGLVKCEQAMDVLLEAQQKAEVARSAARAFKNGEALAQRLFDAKMRRVEAGDRRNRRKVAFGASKRIYEAIIELCYAQLKCAWSARSAAEAETACARAELRHAQAWSARLRRRLARA